MPRKGSRASRAAEAKAKAAMEHHEDDVGVLAGSAGDVDMGGSSRPGGEDPNPESDEDDGFEDEEDDEDDDEDEDDGDQDDDDAEERALQDQEAYDAAMAEMGEEYSSGGESDLIDPPQTFDEDGTPLEGGAALSPHEQLARAMDAVAAGRGGGFGFGAGFRLGSMSATAPKIKVSTFPSGTTRELS